MSFFTPWPYLTVTSGSKRGWRHGTRNGWVNHGCRCDACRAARLSADYNRRQSRKERAALDPSIVPHGAAHALRDYGCRCESCVEAHRNEVRRMNGSEPRRVFSEEEKAEVLRVYATEGLRPAALSASISQALVGKWAKDAGVACYKPPMKHNAATYQRHGCRCELCRAAIREKRKQREARGPGPNVVHGRPTTYSNYRCRCQPCYDAWSALQREYRARRKAS